MLRDKVYFTIDTEDELAAKWPRILALGPDVIKTNLWYSDEFERRRKNPAVVGRKALDPRLLRRIVERAHAGGLRYDTFRATSRSKRGSCALNTSPIPPQPMRAPT